MVTAYDTQSEVKTCRIGDMTGIIPLSLWDSLMDQVVTGRTYEFTNLSTRLFNGRITLTTTRNTKIKQQTTTVALPTTSSNIDDFTTQTNTVTQEVEGSTISIKKLCPKCHSTQTDFNTKEKFHRCTTCKILRKHESYITKYNETLIVKTDIEEISLSVTNSVLTKFLKSEADVTFLDAQDIEEFLLTCGPLTVSYTDDNHVTEMTKLASVETQESDGELCTITEAVSLNNTEQKNPGAKRPASPANAPKHLQPKQTEPTQT